MSKVAIVYDRVNKVGGAEKVLMTLHEMFPQAELFTSIYNAKKAPWANVYPKIHTSFLQKIPLVNKWHEGFGWLMPIAFEQFNFNGYDLVISVTSEAAKGIITMPPTKHVCYMLTPTRYLWSHYDFYFKNPIFRFISKPVIWYLRIWDRIAAKRPDLILANSKEVQRRIKKYYDRDSVVVYSPVNIPSKIKRETKNYYLMVGRIVGYKRIDIAVKAFNKNGKQLVIVGNGFTRKFLQLMAKPNIKFVGRVSDAELSEYYQGAKALIMPQEEDFGIVSLEAQSYGVPVITYAKGGALETVIKNKTGILFSSQTPESLNGAIAKFEKMSFNVKTLISNAKKFSTEDFKMQLLKQI